MHVRLKRIWTNLKAGLVSLLMVGLSWALISSPALAAVDGYVIQYLKASEPVSIAVDAQGNTRDFNATELTEGKRLFENNCKNCHVGGATLPNPRVSLALKALQAATPSRDNVAALVDFQRLPMSYDGSEESYWCRQVSAEWLSNDQLEKLAAFVLRAAEVAPGWGAETFEDL
jgi:photosystem II cytochrome c550